MDTQTLPEGNRGVYVVGPFLINKYGEAIAVMVEGVMMQYVKTRTGYRSFCGSCGRSRYSKKPPTTTRCRKCDRFIRSLLAEMNP